MRYPATTPFLLFLVTLNCHLTSGDEQTTLATRLRELRRERDQLQQTLQEIEKQNELDLKTIGYYKMDVKRLKEEVREMKRQADSAVGDNQNIRPVYEQAKEAHSDCNSKKEGLEKNVNTASRNFLDEQRKFVNKANEYRATFKDMEFEKKADKWKELVELYGDCHIDRVTYIAMLGRSEEERKFTGDEDQLDKCFQRIGSIEIGLDICEEKAAVQKSVHKNLTISLRNRRKELKECQNEMENAESSCQCPVQDVDEECENSVEEWKGYTVHYAKQRDDCKDWARWHKVLKWYISKQFVAMTEQRLKMVQEREAKKQESHEQRQRLRETTNKLSVLVETHDTLIQKYEIDSNDCHDNSEAMKVCAIAKEQALLNLKTMEYSLESYDTTSAELRNTQTAKQKELQHHQNDVQANKGIFVVCVGLLAATFGSHMYYLRRDKVKKKATSTKNKADVRRERREGRGKGGKLKSH